MSLWDWIYIVFECGIVHVCCAPLGELEQTLAMESVSALLRSADVSLPSDSGAGWSLRSLSLADCMRLDTSAIRALNLFPSAIDANKFSSVFGVLNHTQSKSVCCCCCSEGLRACVQRRTARDSCGSG